MAASDARPDTLKDVLAAASDREGIALRFEGRRTPHAAAEFATACFKAANLLRHYGVHPGAECAVVLDPSGPDAASGPTDSTPRGPPGTAAPLSALLGAAAVGARVTLTPEPTVDARALVIPQELEAAIETTGRCSPLVFGDTPEEPGTAHFESERWSQNPVEPPETPVPGDSAVEVDGAVLTHEELLNAVEAVVVNTGLAADQWVVLEAPLDDVDALVAGLLAPLAVGARVFVRAPAARDGDPLPGDVEPVAYRVDAPEIRNSAQG